MIHWPFLRSAIQVVGDFRIGDFDLQSFFYATEHCLQFSNFEINLNINYKKLIKKKKMSQ